MRLVTLAVLVTTTMMTALAAETQDSTSMIAHTTVEDIPLWKQKLYYGYNFDIYFHNNTRADKTENGWSISVIPELGWRVNERVYVGLRFGGSYGDNYATYMREGVDGKTYTESLRVLSGSWEVTPYCRYRLKAFFKDRLGIWMEAHLYTGMDFPRVKDGQVNGTDYDGLMHSVTYGAQLSPVITFQFNKKTALQLYFSIMSLGYSGTTYCYQDPKHGKYKEYSNDIIIFSGRLSNLLSNQFTPGLYGIKIGVIKSF